MLKRRIEDIDIGEVAEFQKTITETDVYMFAGLSGDINPAHINQEYMKDTPFKGRIVHGILTAGLISAVLGNQLPGPGTIYLSQELKFLAPVTFGDTITAIAEVTEKNEEKNRMKLKTICVNQKGKTVLTGYAEVMPPT